MGFIGQGPMRLCQARYLPCGRSLCGYEPSRSERNGRFAAKPAQLRAALSLRAPLDEPTGLIAARCAHAAGHGRDGSP